MIEADDGAGDRCERNEIAAGADRAELAHVRRHAVVEKRFEAADEIHPNSGDAA
jgi:hypothetical protein